MEFVEFLEFIARLADLKFKDAGEMSQKPLEWKIAEVLEELCPAFGLTKRDVNIDIDENSESDDDY